MGDHHEEELSPFRLISRWNQVFRSDSFHIGEGFALPRQAARALLHHDYRNDSTASRMRSLYALHLSPSVAIPAIQPRLHLSGTNRLRSAFHGGQRL
ncbi:MAG: hypothetical protein KZQ66_01330 [Candidatus Thiodiazotropha sp. (ex Lucinoma aequizonata)]|nr:hypothetical protein [Candidatus Thiodiazotropha sp. (ex Lucinoma aequizonata)]